MSDNLPVIVMQNRHNDMQALKLTEEPYKGIMYVYGKVDFDADEENDIAHLKFDYEIIDNANKEYDAKEFEAYIGKILEELIHQGIKDNSLVYTGGIDENRNEDSSESDT
jgi:hypothetical protein